MVGSVNSIHGKGWNERVEVMSQLLRSSCTSIGEDADVAGVQPSVFIDRFSRLLFIVEISTENVVAFHADFAFPVAGEVVHFRHIHKLD